MDTTKRRIRLGLSLALVMVLALASLALADNTVPDGDGTVPVAANPLDLGTVCLGSTVEDDVLIAISRQGNYPSTNVFAKGTTVTISVLSVTGSGLSASMTSTTITLPSNWDNVPNNTMSDAVASHVTFTPTAPGSFSGTIVYRATGTSSKDGSTLTRDGAMTVTASVVVCDTTPPEITPNVSGTLGNNGWYVSDVSVTWTVSDPESGIASSSGCDSTTISSDTSGTTLTCSATNGVGLSNSASVTIKRDATPPTITGSRSPGPNANGWNNTDVTVSFACSDGLSGIDSCSAPVTLSGEGAGQSVTGTAVDKAGNSASATVGGINIDKTPPTITGSRSPDPNANGWNNTDVTVSFACSDGLSGIDSCSAPVTLSGEGAGQWATGTAVDKAGNSASVTVSGINIDKTPPTITGSRSPDPNANGWNNTDVTVSFTCSDGLSGIDTCSPSVTLSDEGAGQSATGTAVDKAGNSASVTVGDINIDKTPPILTIIVPEPYDVRPYGTALNFSATDSLSGVADVKATVMTVGGSWDVSSGYVPGVGVYSVAVWAIDQAGNTIMSDGRTLVIYDPTAGFVTGGGWIWSPKGAYAPDPNLEGKATFGFVAKYQKGAKTPTGQTEFQFKAGNLNFHSESYEWLVVAGAKAQFKGVGTINGAGAYGFLLTAIDGQISGGGGVDKFRIKIWDVGTSSIVYDNQMGKDDYGDFATVLGGGSIVIHTGK